MIRIILVAILLTSCASVKGGDWSDWKSCDVSLEKRDWRFCTTDKDGPDLHHKGLCYQSQECRTRRTMWPFRNKKTEYRTKLIFCEFGSQDFKTCMDNNRIWPKTITQPE